MAKTLNSPGIDIAEVDKSTVVTVPSATKAALIGPTAFGPVEVPTAVYSYADFVRRFGTTFGSGSATQEYYTSIAAKNFFDQGGESLLVTRIVSGTFTEASGTVGDIEFKTLAQGADINDNIKVAISAVKSGSFTLEVREKAEDGNYEVVESYRNLSTDITDPNYVVAAIGDKDSMYGQTSAYVYVSSVPSASVSATGSVQLEGATGTNFTYTNGSAYATASVSASYSNAVDKLKDKETYNFEIISAPGLKGAPIQALAAERQDCIAVVDCTDAAETAIPSASGFDSSYAATYYPWLVTLNELGQRVQVPSSVFIPGMYTASDNVAAPWFAPAGMTRGGIYGAIAAVKKLNKADRDQLYDININPIATFPNNGLVAYGQKTTQTRATALDRINVRRLLINLKKAVNEMASGLLFENNTAALRNSFRAKLEPYLENIVSRQGLYAYKVLLDELNTPEVIDRNEFRCQISIQPSKAIEYIYINFTVTSTGVEFED